MRFAGSHADDLAQEAAIAAWRFGPLFDPERSNMSIEQFIRNKQRQAKLDYFKRKPVFGPTRCNPFRRIDMPNGLPCIDNHTPEPRLMRAIKQFPEQTRWILWMRFWAGYRLCEIAETVRVSQSQVHAIIKSALAELKEKLT